MVKLTNVLIGAAFIAVAMIFIAPWKYTQHVLGTIIDTFCQTVIDTRNRDSSSAFKRKCSYMVKYTVNDKTYDGTYADTSSSFWSIPYSQGQSIDLHYNPENPADHSFHRTGRWIGAVVLTLIGLAIAFFS